MSTREAAPFVAGIGASAGGLQALEAFFENVPKESGIAYVVVQHLSPDFRSVMDELLARRTDLPILHAEHGMIVEPDHVYLNPPKTDMILSEGRLLLSDRERQQDLTLPIDVFFRSLAQDCGPRGIAVVLSGSGTDGSRGIRDVHEAGGLVVVQDVETAQFDGMPKAAREAGVAQWVLPPHAMPRALLDHVRSSSTLGRVLRSERARPSHGIGAVYRLLEEQFGIDFTHYKPSTVTRRIDRRLQLSRATDLEGYLERLRSPRGELDALYRDLLIGVTRFFRNEEAFEVLEKHVLPEQIAQMPKGAPFRVWVAGCATGEEAYSIGIVLQELAPILEGRPVKIFATDVHRGSLEFASRGLYDESAVQNLPPERLERWFVRHGRSYQVAPEIRQNVVFAAHNVIKDPPFLHVDLVTCRNLLIYLQPAAQQKALGLFHFALNRGGVLFLGPSESPGPLLRDFGTVDPHWRIYRKHSDAKRMSVDDRFVPKLRDGSLPQPRLSTSRHSLAHLLGTYDALLDELMPPSLLVTDRGEVVHAFAGASKLLKPRDGRQDLHVADLVEDDLKMVLVGGLQRARKDKAPIVFTGVRLQVDGELRPHRITVRPIAKPNGVASHILVAFEAQNAMPSPPETQTEIDVRQMSRDRASALEEELSHTKENLQAAIEELETSNEELQAANEELLASNEELQSTNEELQSVNEELYTVNTEYQRKIGELTQLSNDVDNLLASTEIGTIFLDHELRIRKFTPKIAETFNLLPQDVGRPIETFSHDMVYPSLAADLRRVVESAGTIEREIRDRGGRAFFLRVFPYRASGAVDGVVLTLVDVSSLKAAEDALFHERYLLNSLLANVPDAIYFKDAAGKIIRANAAFFARVGAGVSDAEDAATRTDALVVQQEDELVLRTGEPQVELLEQRGGDGAARWDRATRLPLRDRSGNVVGVVGILRDVTEQKRAEDKIHEAVRRRDQFLAMLSHELRNPLSAVVTAAELLQKSPENRSVALQILDRQSHQMARLLDDLLEASRVTQNKIELRRSVVDLRAVVRDAADSVRSLMDARGLRFDVEVDGRPLYVDGDAARLQQVQVNLLSNAAKYTPRGGHVMLSTRREDTSAVVTVKDDGAGIPAPMLESVFDLFVQSERTLDRSEGGLGIGLTLVRSLVTLHGGTVTVRSDGEGRGSEFVVRLPITVAPVDSIGGGSKRSLRLPKGAKVAIVEDNADSREVLCAMLEHVGFQCRSAGDGISGVALIDEFRPAVALIDLGLPGIDGFEVARRLRKNPEHASVCLIALTGYGQPQDRLAALEAGFDEHLVKPVVPAQLVELLSGDAGERFGRRTS